MRIITHKNKFVLFFIFFSFNAAFVSAQKVEKLKPNDIEGFWIGTFTVDYGFGKRDSFPYEMNIKRTKNVIEGASASTIEIDGQKYFAKAHIKGEMHDNYLKCAEFENFYEDKLPTPHYWVAFQKMELILRRKANNQLYLEGLYEIKDGTFGRIILEKKPPRV